MPGLLPPVQLPIVNHPRALDPIGDIQWPGGAMNPTANGSELVLVTKNHPISARYCPKKF